jgi:hypothetical protein
MASPQSTNRAALAVPEMLWNPFVAQISVCHCET